MTTWQRTIPILPARDIGATAAFYRDRLDFDIEHAADDYGIVRRGPVEIHLWGPSGIDPADSETMIRVEVDDVDSLHTAYDDRGLVHPQAPLHGEPWGTREFAIRDLDGNLITFFAPQHEP